MSATLRLPHRPQAAEGLGRGLPLALLCHGLLLWALAAGVSWRSSDESAVAEAELWAVVPQAAAPRAEEPVAPPPAPAPPAQPSAQDSQRAEQLREAEIAERKERERERDRQRKLEEERQERQERERKDRQLKQKQQEQRQQQAKAEAEAEKRASKAEEARREKQRQENLRRMQGLAGASGSATATGSAMQSAGPSAGYAGRIKARIKPNITMTELPSGNPLAEVEVRTAPDGLILARRLIKVSGDAAWDQAVLRAIDKTERLPRDQDGRVPPVLVISFRPND